jgi:hypothetical protein
MQRTVVLVGFCFASLMLLQLAVAVLVPVDARAFVRGDCVSVHVPHAGVYDLQRSSLFLFDSLADSTG